MTTSLQYGSLITLAGALLTACSNPVSQADAIMGDSGLQEVLSNIKAEISSGQDQGSSYQNLGLYNCNMLTGLTEVDYADPAPAGSHTFTTTSCNVGLASDPSLVGQECAVTLDIHANGDGSTTQTNMGAVSSGSGDVYAFVFPGGPTTYLILQDNHASGEGCEQEALNAIVWGSSELAGSGDCGEFDQCHVPTFCIVTYIKSSTCGSDGLWKVSVGHGTVE